MYDMFYGAAAFNHPIGQWKTSSLTDMSYMFNSAGAFDQKIDQWNTSSVTNMYGSMYGMFRDAAAFYQKIPEEWKKKRGR